METVIEVADLRRTFKITKMDPGIVGKLASLVRRRYEEVHAVDGISFSIPRGEFVGLVGPNGAGKSTTFKILTGILWPSAGRVRILGRDPHRNRVTNAFDIAAVFGWRSILPTVGYHLPVMDSFHLLRKLYDVPDKVFHDNLHMVEEYLGLKEFLQKPFSTLSQGQWMRCLAAAPLMHDPKILFLDEPTIAMDAIAKDSYRLLLQKVNKEKRTTILLATHDLRDIEQLCSRVMVIDHGKIIYDGSLHALRCLYGEYRDARFTLQAPPEQPVKIDLPVESFQMLACDGKSITVRFDKAVLAPRKVMDAVFRDFAVADVTITEPSIEDVIKWIYGKPKTMALDDVASRS